MRGIVVSARPAAEHPDEAANDNSRIRPYSRVYSPAEVAEYVRLHNPQPPRLNRRAAAYWSGARKEKERQRKIAVALAKWREGIAA